MSTDSLMGFPLNNDQRFKISGPFGEGIISEYNDELTGFTMSLVPVFGERVVVYGGNAYYILNESRRRGFKVERLK